MQKKTKTAFRSKDALEKKIKKEEEKKKKKRKKKMAAKETAVEGIR